MATKKPKFTGEMPHSLEAEQALLGCLLLDPRIQVEVASFLKEEDFFAESHKYIFNSMEDIIKNNQTVDLVTLTDALEKQGHLENAGGIAYITELTNVMPSSANYQRYLDIVTRDSMLRKLMFGATNIIENCKTSSDKISSLAFAEKTVFDVSSTADTSSVVSIGKVIPDVLIKLDELCKDQSAYKGIKTGFKGLDYLLNGVHKSDLMILAARPAVGKTSFAMNIVENIALQGYSCLVFSLEMSKEQLGQRILFSTAGVSMENATKGKLNKLEWRKVGRARELLSPSKIYIDDSAVVTPSELISKCRRVKRKYGLDFVMVDYIQLMSPDAKRRSSDPNRQQEISEISRQLKILAKELDVPVLALSQLSRAVETRKGKPQLSDLRESGAIEQDADIVMFIHRPDIGATEKDIDEGKIKPNVAEIIVAKHRSGPVGTVQLYFRGECTKFVNLNQETGEPELDEENSAMSSQPEEISSYNDVSQDDDLNLNSNSIDEEIF